MPRAVKPSAGDSQEDVPGCGSETLGDLNAYCKRQLQEDGMSLTQTENALRLAFERGARWFSFNRSDAEVWELLPKVAFDYAECHAQSQGDRTGPDPRKTDVEPDSLPGL